MKAFEDSTGKPLEEEKKELASEELIITGSLGEDIGADKATGIVNDIKTEIIKNNTSDTIQIADTINNITNNYNVTLTPEQQKQLEDLMAKIAKQDYDYNQMKDTLNGIKETVNEKLDELGEGVNQGFFDSIKNWFSGIGDWFAGLFGGNEDKDLGILGSTDDSVLGENAIIDATDKDAINLPSSEEVEGFFAKIWNWFTGLFNNDSNNQNKAEQTEVAPNEETNNSIDENNTTEETIDENSSTEETPQDNADATVSNEDDSSLDVQTQDQGSFDAQEQQSN